MEASQLKLGMSRSIPIKVLSAPSISSPDQVQTLKIQDHTTWMTLFKKYLVEGVLLMKKVRPPD